MAPKHEGMHTYRFDDNPQERKFAAAWKLENKNGHVLSWLLGYGDRRVDVTDRDALVAATVIQWLGSSVGQAFLEELGYKKGK